MKTKLFKTFSNFTSIAPFIIPSLYSSLYLEPKYGACYREMKKTALPEKYFTRVCFLFFF